MRLYLLQRLSALVMVPLVLGHLAMMIYAVRGGLSAEEILSRTRGSMFWGSYYGLFVLAASIHAALGLRAIFSESIRINGTLLNGVIVLIGLISFYLGLQAVYAVTWAGAAQ